MLTRHMIYESPLHILHLPNDQLHSSTKTNPYHLMDQLQQGRKKEEYIRIYDDDECIMVSETLDKTIMQRLLSGKEVRVNCDKCDYLPSFILANRPV